MQFLRAAAIAGMMLPMQALGADTTCPTRADLKGGIVLDTTTTEDKRSSVIRKIYQRANDNVVHVESFVVPPSGNSDPGLQLTSFYLYKGLVLIDPNDVDLYARNGVDSNMEGFFPLKIGTSLIIKMLPSTENERTLTVDVLGKTDRLISGCNISFFQVRWTFVNPENGKIHKASYLYNEKLEVWLDDPALFLVNFNLLLPSELKQRRKYTRFSAQPD